MLKNRSCFPLDLRPFLAVNVERLVRGQLVYCCGKLPYFIKLARATPSSLFKAKSRVKHAHVEDAVDAVDEGAGYFVRSCRRCIPVAIVLDRIHLLNPSVIRRFFLSSFITYPILRDDLHMLLLPANV